jgi:hypothetical protein
MLIALGIFLIIIGLVAAWLEKSRYSLPYAGRFGAATNGAAVIIVGAFVVASQTYYDSIAGTLVFLAVVLLAWVLMELIIKRMGTERKNLLMGKQCEAVTDFKLNNNGIAYGKINVGEKVYRAYISRNAKYENDTLEPKVSEAQNNLDTIAEMQENPCIVQKGVSLLVVDVDSMTPRVAMIR